MKIGFFSKRASKQPSSKESKASSASSAAEPSKVVENISFRAAVHSQSYQRYQEAFEKARLEEREKMATSGQKMLKFRTGSFIIKLDAAVQNSKRQGVMSRLEDVPVSIPTELSEVLRSPLLRNAFRNFLRRKYANESLMFFETIEFFKKIPNDEWRSQIANGMIEKFVNDGADFSVNISAEDRSELFARQKSQFWPQDSFDSAQREMYDLMTTNFFIDFSHAYWPGGVLLAVPGDLFSNEVATEIPVDGSIASENLGSDSTVTSDHSAHDTE